MFPIVPVDPRLALNLEPLGTKRKFWYRDASRRMLFKAEERGTGEDWAEKIASELCGLLGLPHVHITNLRKSAAAARPAWCARHSPRRRARWCSPTSCCSPSTRPIPASLAADTW